MFNCIGSWTPIVKCKKKHVKWTMLMTHPWTIESMLDKNVESLYNLRTMK